MFLVLYESKVLEKGAGVMMMQWGNSVVDNLMLACWVEARLAREGLHVQYGYEDEERMKL